MEWIAEIAKEYGLFVALVSYVLWSNQNREKRYITVIEDLADSFQSIKQDINDIKSRIWK